MWAGKIALNDAKGSEKSLPMTVPWLNLPWGLHTGVLLITWMIVLCFSLWLIITLLDHSHTNYPSECVSDVWVVFPNRSSQSYPSSAFNDLLYFTSWWPTNHDLHESWGQIRFVQGFILSNTKNVFRMAVNNQDKESMFSNSVRHEPQRQLLITDVFMIKYERPQNKTMGENTSTLLLKEKDSVKESCEIKTLIW